MATLHDEWSAELEKTVPLRYDDVTQGARERSPRPDALAMLLTAVILLGGTILAGLGLVARLSLGRASLARWPAALHGFLGALGFVALLLGLRGPVRGVRMGAGSFGVVAAGFLAATLLVAATIVRAQWRHRPPSGLAIALHATLAVGGFVMLVAYFSMPPG